MDGMTSVQCEVLSYKFCSSIHKCQLFGLTILSVNLRVPTGAGSQSQDTPTSIPPAFKNFSLSQKEKTLEELVRDQ